MLYADSISKQINRPSSDEHVFNSTKDLHNNTLKNTDYKQNIDSQHNAFAKGQERKTKRGCKTIWFNPLYSCNVATDIVKKVFLFAKQTFPLDI